MTHEQIAIATYLQWEANCLNGDSPQENITGEVRLTRLVRTPVQPFRSPTRWWGFSMSGLGADAYEPCTSRVIMLVKLSYVKNVEHL